MKSLSTSYTNNLPTNTYIIICGFMDVVAGGPIYYRNKVKFMEERGWNVVVIPAHGGKRVLISGMERFKGPYVPFILDNPNEYVQTQREKLIDYLESYIPKNRGVTVVETGTDYTNFWGEALAERIKAKHIIIFLDEKNDRVDRSVIDFYSFKYSRHELACISKTAMFHIFGKSLDIHLDECVGLPCCCSNCVEDYEHPLVQQIERSCYNLGYIGRLEKECVPFIAEAFIQFAQSVEGKSVSVVFFGGAFEEKTVQEIEDMFRSISNVKLIITGYLFPLPYKALKKIDVFVSVSGSAIAAAKAGCVSIHLNMFTFKPSGIINDTSVGNYTKCPYGDTIYDYLRWILIDRPHLLVSNPIFQNDWSYISKEFDKHLLFLDSSSCKTEYYNLNLLGISEVQMKKKKLRKIIGLRMYNTLHESGIYVGVWTILQYVKRIIKSL